MYLFECLVSQLQLRGHNRMMVFTFEFEQDPWPVSAVVPFVHFWRFSVGYVLNNDIRLRARDVAYFDICDKLLLLVL